jgi:serine phosphatase RsbU (regulator of sigma subunit)
VTEAEDRHGAAFTEERCLETVRLRAGIPLGELLDDIHKKIVSHCGTALLADDCTMLGVRRVRGA